MISNPNLVADKVSGVLFTKWLVSAYIFHKGRNITNFFASTGSVDPLIIKYHQIINTTKIMRLMLSKSCGLYNVCHRYRSFNFHTKINPMTVHTWLGFMRKDRVIIHPFHTVLYNLINLYHPFVNLILYVCNHTYYKKSCLVIVLYIYIRVWPYIQRYLLTQSYRKSRQTLNIHILPSTIVHEPLYMRQPFPVTRKHLSHYSQKSTKASSHVFLEPVPIIAPSGWGTAPIDAWSNW